MSEGQRWVRADAFLRRAFDVVGALAALALTSWVIVLAVLAASIDTRKWGVFVQMRVGLHGRLFRLFKIRTMRDVPGFETKVTTGSDPRITRLGRALRATKIDELPQLFNVLIGDMSFVGPRPDVPGYADELTGEDRLLLSVRPGITGPATLAYRDEEALLAAQSDPEAYNRHVLFPHKVKVNLDYLRHRNVATDLRLILCTIAAVASRLKR
jgi:lipopolysaccharide/colanic/teichoic acid biosynthesis glycosyltransferase